MIKGKPVNSIKGNKIPIFNNAKEIANLLENIKNTKNRGSIKHLLLATIYSKGLLKEN